MVATSLETPPQGHATCKALSRERCAWSPHTVGSRFMLHFSMRNRSLERKRLIQGDTRAAEPRMRLASLWDKGCLIQTSI